MRKSSVRTVKAKPDLAVLWNNKGAEFFRLHRYDEAKVAFNQAAEIKPNLVPAFYNLANVYVMEGKKEEAISNLRKAIQTDPSFKETVKKANCFKRLWNDKDFRRLIN